MNNTDASIPEEWSLAMARFYHELEAEMSGLPLRCEGCGLCCHFEKVDHILFASNLERLYLLAGAAFPPLPDAEPDLLLSGKRCPYQAKGKCQARGARPLGCRLYFCAPWPENVDEFDFSERWHRRLKEIHERLGVEWGYSPLLPL